MKKFLLMITIFLCITPTVFGADYIFNGETLPATSSYRDTYYGVETMKNILDDLEITYDDTTILAYTYYANQGLKFFRATYDENTTPLNICFAKQSTSNDRIHLIVSNGSFDDDLGYMYLNTNYTSTASQVIGFVNWNYNTSGAISSATTQSILTIKVYSSKYEISNTSTQLVNDGKSQEGSVLYYDKLLAPIESFTTAGYTTLTGYSWYFIGNTIRFTAEPEVDIPSGDDTESGDTGGGDTGGGSGSTDLTMTNAKIDELNKHAEEILNKMPSSGDIEEATQNGVVQGSTDYWGSSGDVSGDEQEVLIENEMNNFIGTMSGDIAKSEIFDVLQTYEDKLFGSFTGEEDFKIEWQDVSYMGNIIIPAGSVNFSEICRENEALGKVKSTINIILTFIILMNIVIYMYNLLLATLGIDNPYLYEKPVGSVTVAEYTDEKGNTYTTTTQHDGRGNSIGRRYQNSTGNSSNSRKIGFNVPQYKRWWR